MELNSSTNFNIFVRNSFNLFLKDESINFFLKIEGWKNLTTNQIEKLSVSIYNKKEDKQKVFTIKNDEQLTLKQKIRNILIESINQKFISKDSKVFVVFDNSLSGDFTFGTILIEVSRVLYRIARFNLAEYTENNLILEKILDIAEEIRKEGREGKMIGTLFVIGNEDELNPYLSQLILNPFYGYPEEMRDLINNDLSETIKEYAQLDGAFIINNKGIIRSCGTYINVDTSNVKRYYGWGTKHLTAAAITEKTKSIAVLVSESGNTIKIFKNGRLILKY